jgi:hypothetical protein
MKRVKLVRKRASTGWSGRWRLHFGFFRITRKTELLLKFEIIKTILWKPVPVSSK